MKVGSEIQSATFQHSYNLLGERYKILLLILSTFELINQLNASVALI